MLAPKLLLALSAGIAFLLGGVHLAYTFSGTALLPRDPGLQAAMAQAPLAITRETTVLRAWVGFNASHAIALLAFGLVYGFLALAHPRLLFGSAYLLAVGAAVLGAFLVLARLYWFSVPFAGVALALGCYAAAVVASRF